MKESSTYQSILEEGEEKGRREEARRILLQVGVKRLGEPNAVALSALNAIASQERLEQLIGRALEVESWQELLN